MQGIGLASQVRGATVQDRESLAKSSIWTLDECGIDDTTTLAELQQVIDHFLAALEPNQRLAEGDGAVGTSQDGTSGFRKVAMVFPNQAKYNSHPMHPDNPGQFPGQCEVQIQGSINPKFNKGTESALAILNRLITTIFP